MIEQENFIKYWNTVLQLAEKLYGKNGVSSYVKTMKGEDKIRFEQLLIQQNFMEEDKLLLQKSIFTLKQRLLHTQSPYGKYYK